MISPFKFFNRHRRITGATSFTLALALLFASCSSKQASITIKTDSPVDETVTMTLRGRQHTDVKQVKKFPVHLTMDYGNMPVDVSFEAERHNLQPFTIDKIYKGSRSHKFWSVAGGWFTALGAIAMLTGGIGFAEKDDDGVSSDDGEKNHLIPVNVNQQLLLYGGIGLAAGITFLSIGSARSRASVYEPEQNTYVTAVSGNLSRFDVFGVEYIQAKMAEWEKKGEFESSGEYKKRVNNGTKSAKLEELTKQAAKEFIRQRAPQLDITYYLSQYDADNESFLVTTNKYGSLLIKVPAEEAQSFKDSWSSYRKSPEFGISGPDIVVTSCEFSDFNGKTYLATADRTIAYAPKEVTGSGASIDYDALLGDDFTISASDIKSTKISNNADEIDTKIPITGADAKNTLVVAIGNENYANAANVPFAANDAKVFQDYCVKTLGVPATNVKYYKDATRNDIIAAKEWLRRGLDTGKDKNVIFYYAGHGIPDPKTSYGYLLPADAYPDIISTGYSLASLYDDLNQLGADNVTVILDACFSGAKRDGGVLGEGTRGVAIKSNETVPSGSGMLILSAASGTETANPYNDKGHGLFTYFLLKKLKDSKGKASLGEIYDYVYQQVNTEAFRKEKQQHPSAITSHPGDTSWRDRKLAK